MTKTLKDFMEVYRPKSPDEQKFVDKHVTIKHSDRNGNSDEVFNGNTKYIKRKEERHGYDVGEDEKVYEEVEDLDELSRGTLVNYTHKAIHTAMKTSDATPEGKVKREKRLKGAGLAAKKLGYNEEVEDLDEDVTHRVHGYYDAKTSRGYDTRPVSIKVKADNEEHAKKIAAQQLSNHKNYKPTKVVSLDEDVKENLEEGTMKLSKVHIVHHHDHPAAKEFAKHYTDAMKGDHREGGPTEKDEAAANKFHERYTGVRTREGFAGSGTHIYTDHKTGAKWKVDRHPNGKTFYGTDHIISHYTPSMHESVEADYYFTEEEDMAIRSLANAAEEHGEELDLETLAGLAEEVLSELSKKTLGSYVSKAAKSATGNIAGAVAAGVSGTPSEHGRQMGRQALQRLKGIDTAVKKLTKEEVEELDELSKKTLSSYAKKATNQAFSKGVSGGAALASSNKEIEAQGHKLVNKAAKRMIGAQKAISKLTKEDIINRTIEKYMPEVSEYEAMTNEERLVAKLDGLSEGHIHTLLDLFNNLSEDNQMKMLNTCDTQEGVRGLLDFAIQNRGK